MLENCQNQELEKTFINNLVPLAREIQKLQQTRQCIKEFANEECNFPLKQIQDVEMKISNDINEIEDAECLKMEVYDDKDYDIEEIKFWNFISKNKGIKPSVIRTIVYKVPESSYIIRKVPVIIDEPEDTKPIEDKEKKEIQSGSNTQRKEIKDQVKISEKLENNVKVRIDPPSTKNEKIPPNLAKINQKSNTPVKFSSEDIIVIDEDDDIIGFDDDNEDKEDKKETKEESIEGNETDESQMESNSDEDEDDDIIEEDYIEKQEENLENDEPDPEINVDQKLDSLHTSIQKRKRGRGNFNRPKVVIEKANEPASTISVKKSETNSKVVKSGSLNKSLPVIAQTKSVNARKSQTIKTEIKKSKDQVDISANLVSSSSSNASTISSSLLNTSLGNEASRVTRSKAKLIENAK